MMRLDDADNLEDFQEGFNRSAAQSRQSYLDWLRWTRFTRVFVVVGAVVIVGGGGLLLYEHQQQEEEIRQKQIADAEQARLDRLSRLTFATAADDADVGYVCSSKEPLGLSLKEHMHYITKCECDHRIGHRMDNTCMIAAQQR